MSIEAVLAALTGGYGARRLGTGGPGWSLLPMPRSGLPARWPPDLRLPWERPAPPGRFTPARVRHGFRDIRTTMPCLAGAPKPGKPGPGPPPGPKNRRPAIRYDVGKRRRES